MRNHIIKLVENHAVSDPNVIFLTGDLGFSVVEGLQAKCGERFINAGVAEANMISMAAGLGSTGFKPYLYSIVPFITMRCFEQIRNDLAYHKVPARIIGVGAGYAYGTLGPSHHALEDTHVISGIPHTTIVNSANVAELEYAFHLLRDSERVVYFRIGKDKGPEFTPAEPVSAAYRVRAGRDLNLVVSGHILGEAIAAVDTLEKENQLTVNLISCPLLHPYPKEKVDKLLISAPVVTLVEAYPGNVLEHGVMQSVLARSEALPYLSLHATHEFSTVVGDAQYQRNLSGIDAARVTASIRAFLESKQVRYAPH